MHKHLKLGNSFRISTANAVVNEAGCLKINNALQSETGKSQLSNVGNLDSDPYISKVIR